MMKDIKTISKTGKQLAEKGGSIERLRNFTDIDKNTLAEFIVDMIKLPKRARDGVLKEMKEKIQEEEPSDG